MQFGKHDKYWSGSDSSKNENASVYINEIGMWEVPWFEYCSFSSRTLILQMKIYPGFVDLTLQRISLVVVFGSELQIEEENIKLLNS